MKWVFFSLFGRSMWSVEHLKSLCGALSGYKHRQWCFWSGDLSCFGNLCLYFWVEPNLLTKVCCPFSGPCWSLLDERPRHMGFDAIGCWRMVEAVAVAEVWHGRCVWCCWFVLDLWSGASSSLLSAKNWYLWISLCCFFVEWNPECRIPDSQIVRSPVQGFSSLTTLCRNFRRLQQIALFDQIWNSVFLKRC